jgi:hypothetical protein
MVSEPVFITTQDFGPHRHGNNVDHGGQYITFCYVGQIPADAVRPTLSFVVYSNILPVDVDCRR